MGSTAVGRALTSAGTWVAKQTGVGGTVGDLLKDPGRAFTAAATLGMSEVGNAVDNKLFNDTRNRVQDATKKTVADANALIDEQREAASQADLVKERDIARARMRALTGSMNGRNSTILTSPLGATSSSSSGLKKLLGE